MLDKKELARQLTVIVPAYNEEASVADTVESLAQQSTPPEEVIVIDDCSTDQTAAVAKAAGAIVIQPPQNTGSKAGAQNYALVQVNTKYVMALDADTTLEKDAIEKLLPALVEPEIAAACGFVVPRYVKTVWERGRYIEYLLAFTFYKPIQDYFGKPLISSGCFSIYKTDVLKQQGGWQTRTMAEDMDLTWSFYEQGLGVRFVPEAVCYPIEPTNYSLISKQLKRWSHGFMQNVMLHSGQAVTIPYLNYMIAIALWDGIFASITYIFLLPLLAIIFRNPIFLVGYIVDAPAILIPVLVKAVTRKETLKALVSLPSFFVIRTINGLFLLEAVWTELVLKRPLRVYEKGH